MSRYEGPTTDVKLREALNYAAGSLEEDDQVVITVEKGSLFIEAWFGGRKNRSDSFFLQVEPDGELAEDGDWLANGIRKGVDVLKLEAAE